MFRPGDQIGPYTLVDKLGKGAFGVVWLAERRTQITTTNAAIKIPLDEDISIETIKNEADVWVRASGHPNVLPIIEADIYGEHIIIASEYAPDGSLDAWLKKHGKAPTVESAVEIVSGILSGLEHLHSRNIIHRDLKPANILFQGITPRLADFGISRVLKSTSQSSNIMGTPSYMAPEAFDGKRNAQTDIWSVGVIFYQLLSGRLPFEQADITSLLGAILTRNPEPLPPTVPQPLQNVIARALFKDPNNRYKSAAEMRAALRKPRETDPNFQPDKSMFTVVSSPVNTSPPYPIQQPIQSQVEKKNNTPHFVYAIAGLLAVIILASSFVFLFKQSGTSESNVNSSNSITKNTVDNRSLSSSTQPSRPSWGEFIVNASSERGTQFTNPFTSRKIINFHAVGTWTYNEKVGFHGANGHPLFPTGDRSYPLPNSAGGCLVIRRGNGVYEFVGENRDIELSPNESVTFLINDGIGSENGISFEDNKGALTISWKCQNCS